MMGSWKSTVSKMLASKLKYDLVDIDQDIQEFTGLSISGIFELYGEQGFRNMESKYFKEIAKEDNKVISTGGGIVISKENREILKRKGTSIYLKASPDSLAKRIKNFDNRPLLNQTSKKTINSQLSVILRNREKFYKECSLYVVDTDNSKPSEILVRLSEIIKNERI